LPNGRVHADLHFRAAAPPMEASLLRFVPRANGGGYRLDSIARSNRNRISPSLPASEITK
jgi:hypothetical protein